MTQPGDTTAILTIRSLERLNNSFYGNPRWKVTFTDGTVAKTQSDASCAYGIENPEYRDVPLTVTFTRAGLIRYIEVAPASED